MKKMNFFNSRFFILVFLAITFLNKGVGAAEEPQRPSIPLRRVVSDTSTAVALWSERDKSDFDSFIETYRKKGWLFKTENSIMLGINNIPSPEQAPGYSKVLLLYLEDILYEDLTESSPPPILIKYLWKFLNLEEKRYQEFLERKGITDVEKPAFSRLFADSFKEQLFKKTATYVSSYGDPKSNEWVIVGKTSSLGTALQAYILKALDGTEEPLNLTLIYFGDLPMYSREFLSKTGLRHETHPD